MTTIEKTLPLKKSVSVRASASKEHAFFVSHPDRTVEWIGGVNYENLDKVLGDLKRLKEQSNREETTLLVNSYGGVTGIAMSFYDAVRTWLSLPLTTIGSGDVDSSGIIVFLAGRTRYITKSTTMLLHLAGRTFEAGKRYTTADMEAMLREDRIKDDQYAAVVAEATGGRCSAAHVLELMRRNTILLPEEAVNLGLAHKVI